ncbi:MAG TPA: hypothetical protein VL424_15375 [Pararobbsia sp.]|jgi:hypothetical protein|nr:hypothetical protein [Pararobbsia sp.]
MPVNKLPRRTAMAGATADAFATGARVEPKSLTRVSTLADGLATSRVDGPPAGLNDG